MLMDTITLIKKRKKKKKVMTQLRLFILNIGDELDIDLQVLVDPVPKFNVHCTMMI